MGSVSADLIQKAADYLLAELAKDDVQFYSRFYDGTDECHEKLRKDMTLSLDGDRWCPAEILLDLAVWELESECLIERVDSDELLPDGEKDYAFGLTREGKLFLLEGKRLKCSHATL